MRSTALICIVILVLCALSYIAPSAEAKFIKGHAKGKNFVFLGKFCYAKVPYNNTKYWDKTGSAPADLMKLVITSAAQNSFIALYDDTTGHWPSLYHHSTSCEKRVTAADKIVSIANGTESFTPRDVVNPHFWYVAALPDCAAPTEIDFKYELTMENSYGGHSWIEQFSCDEIGLEGLYIFYFVFYLILAAVHGYAVYSLIRSDSYHSIVKLLTTTLVLEALSVFCFFIHYAVYQHDGVGAPALKGLAEMLDLMSQVVLILLLTLIAKGWCISKMKLDDGKIVLGIIGALTVAYLIMFIWENAGLDPASTIYIYQSAPGIIILVLRSLAMLWFIWCLRNTYMEENHPSKRQFYLWFGGLFVLWYIGLPIITIIASAIKAWYRQRTVTILYVTFNAIALSGLSFLLWPSRASEYFQISSRLDLAGTIPYDSI